MSAHTPAPAAASKHSRKDRPTLQYRLDVALRALAAIAGGYGVTSLGMTALALTLPGSKVDVVVASTLIGLALFPAAVMWCFAARNAARAWLGLLIAALLFYAVIVLQRGFGGAA